MRLGAAGPCCGRLYPSPYGMSVSEYVRDAPIVSQALGGRTMTPADSAASDTRADLLAAVISAEVCDFDRLQRDSLEQAGRAAAQLKEAIASLAIKHRGTVAEAVGNTHRATFASPSDAVACAVALQDAIDERNKGLGEGDQVDVRAGVALGVVERREGILSGPGVAQADALRGLGEPGDVFLSGAVYEGARGAAVNSFAAEGIRAITGEEVSVYVLDPARAERQAEKRQWQSRWEQHQHGWGRHRERHFERSQRRHERWEEKQFARETRHREREQARRVPRTPEEKADRELAAIKRLYRNMVYGGLVVLFLFLINVMSSGTPLWFLWPAVGVAFFLALQAVRTLGPDAVGEGLTGAGRRWRGWLSARKEWAERSDDELADQIRRKDEDERTVRRRISKMRAFQRRIAMFGVIVVVLFVINLMSSPGDWWVVWPMLGLGFVLALNAVGIYGIDGLLGPDWEERKRQELLARFQREA